MGKINNTSTAQFSNGFTLLNLLISTSIIAILTSIAAPSFASIISNGRISAASADLSTTLALSRNHALSTGVTVIVCHAKDNTMTQCSDSRERNTNWLNGIISYADINGDNTLDSHDQVLTTSQHHASISMVFNQTGRLRFFSDGSARSAGFYLCSNASEQQRHLRILHTGRARTQSTMGESQLNTCLSKAL